MISHKHKSIFIHVPKCAGSSFHGICKKHSIKLDVLNLKSVSLDSTDIKYEDHFKFSFVRNPWDRMVSNWCMWSTWRKPYWFKTLTFKEFVDFSISHIVLEKISNTREWCDDRCPIEYIHSIYNHCAPYTDPFYHLFNNDGELIINFVGRFENLQGDFDIVCDKIGIPRQQLPHKNATKHKHYTEYYDDETRQIVAEKYAKDIDYFGYEFGDL